MKKFLHINRFARVAALVFAGACAFLVGGQAYADNLVLGSNYNPVSIILNGGQPQNEGGGPITPSYLNGALLNPTYCVDLFHNINVPGTYSNTLVRNDGVVNSSAVNNAGAVAWILNNLSLAATTVFEQQAVQVLIWSKIYDGTGGNTVLADSGAGYYNQFLSYQTALGSNTAALSSVLWLTPGNTQGQLQGLASAVPIPAALFFVGPALIGMLGGFRRKSASVQLPA